MAYNTDHRFLHSLGYIGVSSPRSAEWPEFATSLLGMEVLPLEGGGQRMRWDDRAYRLTVHDGDEDRIEYLGWETADGGMFARAIDELTARGVEVVREPAEVAGERMVRELISFSDPFGTRHEVFWGAVEFDRSFRGTRTTTAFRTGSQGLGHAVMVVPDLEIGMQFYQDVLGLRVTDLVKHGEHLGTMCFMRCNTRHHSLALWEMPGRLLGLQHIMVESESVDEVGRAYDVLQKSRWEVSATLGRHVGDEQMSFYVRSPSGFDVELGCDSIDIDDETWTARLIDRTAGAPNEVWGHHFQALDPQSSIRPAPRAPAEP